MACLAAMAVLLSAGARAETDQRRFEYRHLQMGTWFRLVAYASDAAKADEAASAAFARIDALNAALSDYLPDSEVSRLTTSENVRKDVPISEDLCRILRAVRAIERESRGAFDLTAGPLTKLWRRARDAGAPPSSDAIENARRLVGYEMLAINPKGRTARPAIDGMQLDLGGVAKGYAADCAIDECRKRGLNRVLLAAGGDIVVAAPPPGQDGWRIGLPPRTGSGFPDECIILSNAAISTSGDKNQYLEHGGKRYSHVIDPRTGNALIDACTVSVVTSGGASNGLMADALATTVNVLGPDEGPRLLSRFGIVGARVICPGPSGPSVIITPGFSKWPIVPRLPEPPNQTGSEKSRDPR